MDDFRLLPLVGFTEGQPDRRILDTGIPISTFKVRLDDLEEPARVRIVLKVSTCKTPTPPFRHPSKATPSKNVTVAL